MTAAERAQLGAALAHAEAAKQQATALLLAAEAHMHSLQALLAAPDGPAGQFAEPEEKNGPEPRRHYGKLTREEVLAGPGKIPE